MNRHSRFNVLPAMVVFTSLAAAPAMAQKGVPPTSVIVGGHPMPSDHDIADNLSGSADHTVFVRLLRSAGMFDALQGHGPFTVFAPTDAAFGRLPPGLLDGLEHSENKGGLVALLSMQILPGNYSLARLRYLIRGGKGQVEIDTVDDAKLNVTTNGPANLVLRDPKGDTADIVIYDAKQANGVVFVTDRVLLPG
jgi:uncharacterized surface protein with fasciclin (FAS1) repeats